MKNYIIGFALSIVLTLAAYLLTLQHIAYPHMIRQDFIIYTTLTLAVVQMIVQGVFFLHLGREANPRWNLLFFISTIGVVLIVVIGAVWIMNHLNYNMMPEQMEHAIIEDELIYK